MSKEEDFVKKYSFEGKSYSIIEDEMGIERLETRELYDKTKSRREEIQFVKNKFNAKRKEDFGNNFQAFYTWYQDQSQKCGYCEITQEELYEIFREERKLPLNDAIKRSSGTLEIERRNSSENSYQEENIILACPLCNNAKSNLIDEDSWKTIFVAPMKVYYNKILCEIRNKKGNENG